MNEDACADARGTGRKANSEFHLTPTSLPVGQLEAVGTTNAWLAVGPSSTGCSTGLTFPTSELISRLRIALRRGRDVFAERRRGDRTGPGPYFGQNGPILLSLRPVTKAIPVPASTPDGDVATGGLNCAHCP